MSIASAYQYRVGGHLPIDAPSYVVRAADQQFYAGLKAGELCYVLNSRQMGKTSLRFRTMHLLQQDGMACVAIDLQGIGSHNITPQQWYAGLVKRLVQGLNLTSLIDVRSWWQEREVISPVQRFSEFIEVVLPKCTDRQVIIFIDEIDSILSLDFDTDDFFAAIRACSEFKQINFALVGVATPADLIKDGRRSPFNIGQAIELRGFQTTEIQPLVHGLIDKAVRPEVVIEAILAWTGGQPFLTQKLCKLIQELDAPLPSNYETEFIESLVRSKILLNWESQDEPEHLKTIRNYLIHHNHQKTEQALSFYQEILVQGAVFADNRPAQVDLRLSGLVMKKNDQLEVSNRIYAQVFDQQWLDRVFLEFRPYGKALAAWLATDRQDSAQLLQGKALQAAKAWSQGKTLPAQDLDFLAASKAIEEKSQQRSLIKKIMVATSGVMILAATTFFWRSPQNMESSQSQPNQQSSAEKPLPAVSGSPIRSPITNPTTSSAAVQSQLPSLSKPEPTPITAGADRAINSFTPRRPVRDLLADSRKRRNQYQDNVGSLLDAVRAAKQFQQIKRVRRQQQLHLPVLNNLRQSLLRIRQSQGNIANNTILQTQNLSTLMSEGCQELRKDATANPNFSSDVRQVCVGN